VPGQDFQALPLSRTQHQRVGPPGPLAAPRRSGAGRAAGPTARPHARGPPDGRASRRVGPGDPRLERRPSVDEDRVILDPPTAIVRAQAEGPQPRVPAVGFLRDHDQRRRCRQGVARRVVVASRRWPPGVPVVEDARDHRRPGLEWQRAEVGVEEDSRARLAAPSELGGGVQREDCRPPAPIPGGVVGPAPGLPPVEEGGTSPRRRDDADERRRRGDRADQLVQCLHQREGRERASQPLVARSPRGRRALGSSPPAAASSVRPAGVGYHRRAGRPRSVGGRTSAASPRRSSAASRRFALSISRSPLNWETVAAPTSGNRSTSRSVSRSAGVSARIGLPDVRVSGGSGMVVMPPPPPAARRRAASCPYRRGLRSRGSDDRSARPAAGLSVPRA
jgi:hypothetical protein